MVFCSLIASNAIRAFMSALKLRRCLDFIPAPFPRPRFYTLLTGPNLGEHLRRSPIIMCGLFQKERGGTSGAALGRLLREIALVFTADKTARIDKASRRQFFSGLPPLACHRDSPSHRPHSPRSGHRRGI